MNKVVLRPGKKKSHNIPEKSANMLANKKIPLVHEKGVEIGRAHV